MGWAGPGKGKSKSVSKPLKKAQSTSSDEDEAGDEPEVPKSIKSGIKRPRAQQVEYEDEPESEDSENLVDLLVKFINLTNSITQGSSFFDTIEGIKVRQRLTGTFAAITKANAANPGLPAFCLINELQLDTTAPAKKAFAKWLEDKFGAKSYDEAVKALKRCKRARAPAKV
jgi:hypothetical protein